MYFILAAFDNSEAMNELLSIILEGCTESVCPPER